MLAALVGQLLTSVIFLTVGLTVGLEDPGLRGVLDLVFVLASVTLASVTLASVTLAARLVSMSIVPRFAPDYLAIDSRGARRVTLVAGGTLGAVLLVTLPIVAPSGPVLLALLPGPLVIAATVGGVLLAPSG